MRLLFSLYLPLLPLEALRPSWSEPGIYAVMDRDQVLVASPLAIQEGVRQGMRVGGVTTIVPQTTLLDRDPIREDAALAALATALLQYTPEVAFADNFGVTLDVGGSLRLFGGPLNLCRRVRASAATLGFTAVLGAAPTAAGAWLLAHNEQPRHWLMRRRCLTQTTLVRRLDALRCGMLPAAAPYVEWFHGIGALHLGAVRRLPRAGLLRRTSKELVSDMDLAYGRQPEMLQWMKVPPAFSARVETFDRIEHAEALMVGAAGLILQMVGWLTLQQLAVTTFTLAMEHERGHAAILPTLLEITLAEPAWKEPHLLRLLRERLAKVELTAPVIALRLDARKLEAMQPPTDQLFPEPGGSPQDFNRLLELLSARLGADNVLVPADVPDHRPEMANMWVPATGKVRRPGPVKEALERPSWVLAKPIPLLVRGERPFYGSPLKVIQGPERIEAGWWNDQTVGRDYYIAQGTDASCYWIYLERTLESRWFLHGLYA